MNDFNPTKLILCGRKNILLTHLIKKRTKEGKKKKNNTQRTRRRRTNKNKERKKKEEIKNWSPTDESRSFCFRVWRIAQIEEVIGNSSVHTTIIARDLNAT